MFVNGPAFRSSIGTIWNTHFDTFFIISFSSSNFIPCRIQQHNTACMANIANNRVIIGIVMWCCWWPPEKPWAYQAGSHFYCQLSWICFHTWHFSKWSTGLRQISQYIEFGEIIFPRISMWKNTVCACSECKNHNNVFACHNPYFQQQRRNMSWLLIPQMCSRQAFYPWI